MSSRAEDLMRRHRYTADEYRRMGEAGILREGDRVELIEGEIVDMAPTGSAHAGAVKRLNQILSQAVAERAIVAVQDPLPLAPFSQAQPDIALLAPRSDCYSSAHPTPADVFLVVEVADASRGYDRELKAPLYARHGIPEVWLVDLAGRLVTRYRQPRIDGYQDAAPSTNLGEVRLPTPAGLSIDLRALVP